MRRIVLISLLTAILCIAAASAHHAQAGRNPAAGPVGSFQILAGRYAIGGIAGAEGADLDTNGIFRIDTRTGQTWMYMTGRNKAGKGYDGWSPIPEAVAYSK